MTPTITRCATLCGIVAAMLASAQPAGAQRAVEIPDRPTCPRCRIELRPVATLRELPDSVLFDDGWARVERDSRGRFYAVDRSRTSIAVFDSAGRFLRRIGRGGDGPGEFRWIYVVAMAAGDTLHVPDSRHRRETTLSPSYRVVRSRSFPSVVYEMVPLPGGTSVTNVVSGSRELAGLPLQIVDTGGKVLRAFGNDQSAYRADIEPSVWRRSLAVRGARDLFAARRQEYVIELWDLMGTKRGEWVRRADWFEPWLVPESLRDREQPRPILTAVRAAPDGLLWVMVAVGDGRYREAIAESDQIPHGIGRGNRNRYYDTIVEVLDLRSARVLARQRFDNLLHGFFGSGLTAATPEADGDQTIEIYTMQLDQP
ncbi:MAG: 6-bladed beta-propeller [Gemmatimonadales bacterium]